MLTAVAILLFALTRAEIIQRMRAPVVNRADGMIRVYADCGEDVRREFQSPVARFASDTVDICRRNLGKKLERYASPLIVIHIGDVRTNDASVVTRVATNGSDIVTRFYLRNPATADLARFRIEVVKAFNRSIIGRELDDASAIAEYRHGIPELRIADERKKLVDWRAGRGGVGDDEGLRLIRKVIEPGFPSKSEVLTFASRLYLYPAYYDASFLGKFHSLDFRTAVKLAPIDPTIRFAAFTKADSVVVLGGGRGEKLSAAAAAYSNFLRELARQEMDRDELMNMLEDAEAKLCLALEGAK